MMIVRVLRHLLLVAALAVALPAYAQTEAEGDPLVRDIQQGLKELGYEVRVVDGLYGPNTRSAIEAFQTKHDREVTGEVSETLRAEIQRLLFRRSQEARRIWTQSRLYLKALGYTPGDGEFDSPAARRALEAFVEDHFLTVGSGFSETLHGIIARRARADERAQTHLCHRFMREKVYDKALSWCRRVARKDNVEAQYLVGWMYYYGRGAEQSYAKAFEWYHRAARAGDSRAQTFVGLMYRHGQGVDRNPDAAHHWYQRAVE
ncbi:peptidoglycan-binding protein [Ferruginivarius sediminum]|uniref:Peptidoglycan binding-like domain-containing protein n=1 Tax=Ferruginivarius sediminum TaxID=2661937 RepID=A0A369TAB8_9PROT|nr:peptidoglycan-binding protein [Ferruginivarius sediminum]RDD61325.1 hypothetical protein DRB17_13725 [Ferruginivarius sediminum]